MTDNKFDIGLGVLTVIALIAFCIGSFQLQLKGIEGKYKSYDVYFPTTMDGDVYIKSE
jgi:hypothetical protein|tara:strand:+ start:171646 stop:171819 length:174 start_codon:yes stop_codon:yes gene_type:complete